MMKSVEKCIKDTHFASENDKQQAIEAAETKLHKEINELGEQNQINSTDISDCISALTCDYTNESQVDEEQQGIDENLYDIHYDQLMIDNENTNEMNIWIKKIGIGKEY
ncbi:MAG: hypothetical protein EZS28_045516 [Streblomastix strix]|uniref:Uncharacterized protein n=1 Tax=Streblomastix strix TaxID=222440 RepID=A0A5J4TKY2_9EUKA|nr:MAG: hypothetical protein EZS28_045516 [Streblomastix strix]